MDPKETVIIPYNFGEIMSMGIADLQSRTSAAYGGGTYLS